MPKRSNKGFRLFKSTLETFQFENHKGGGHGMTRITRSEVCLPHPSTFGRASKLQKPASVKIRTLYKYAVSKERINCKKT